VTIRECTEIKDLLEVIFAIGFVAVAFFGFVTLRKVWKGD